MFTISLDRWVDKYKPIFNPRLGMEELISGAMFETYGDDLSFINAQPRNKVWTWVEGDDGEDLIVSGFAYVNRIGYFVTEDTWDEVGIIVPLD